MTGKVAAPNAVLRLGSSQATTTCNELVVAQIPHVTGWGHEVVQGQVSRTFSLAFNLHRYGVGWGVGGLTLGSWEMGTPLSCHHPLAQATTSRGLVQPRPLGVSSEQQPCCTKPVLCIANPLAKIGHGCTAAVVAGFVYIWQSQCFHDANTLERAFPPHLNATQRWLKAPSNLGPVLQWGTGKNGNNTQLVFQGVHPLILILDTGYGLESPLPSPPMWVYLCRLQQIKGGCLTEGELAAGVPTPHR